MRIGALVLGPVMLLVAVSGARAEEKPLLDEIIPGALSGTVAATTEYMFRGISQSDGAPAIQGSVDYGWGPFYAGWWGSNISFGGNIETDISFGLSDTYKGITWNLGGIYYGYPADGDPALDFDYWEVAGSLGYDFGLASATLGFNYSPDFFQESGDAFYPSIGIDVPLLRGFGLSLHGGYQAIDKEQNFGTPDYFDWSIGLSAAWSGFDLTVSYIDTDLSDSECFGSTSGELCDARALFTVSRAF